MAKVELTNVSKRFGDVVAVDTVNLSITDGELMVFVGPSGCGKSTTLRMVAGLETVSGGSIHIGERDVTRLQPKDRNVAMVFQNYALYAHKNVYDNLGFGLRVRGARKDEIDRRVRWAATMLGIEELLSRKPKQLSGGQMQRVALGRALVRNPEVFLLDEPLSNLDAKMRVRMRKEIAKLHSAIGTSMIYVTHDQIEAMTLGHRIAVMNQGRVQQIGHPLEIYDRPANLFVAHFIGSPEMNLIEGEIGAGDQGAVFACDGLVLPIPTGGAFRQPPSKKVVLGIRPEHLPLAENGQAGIQVEVVLAEQMGAQTLLNCRRDGVVLNALIGRNDTVRSGDTVALQVSPGNLHLFDPESSQSLLADSSDPRAVES